MATVVAEVPSYADAFSGRMGRTIEAAVEQALAGFLRLTAVALTRTAPRASSRPWTAHTRWGKGRHGKGASTDVLLAAYRVVPELRGVS